MEPNTELSDNPSRVIPLLVADALEALLPLIDEWSREAEHSHFGEHVRGYADGYHAGVRSMAAEVKDQLVERILLLRDHLD